MKLCAGAYRHGEVANYTAGVMSVYLDHAATAPLRPEAAEAFLQAARELGNPSAIHSYGRSARRLVDEAREEIAALLGADPAEVIFTSGGTESDNLAVQGGWFATRESRPGVVVSGVEHPAVLETAHWLAGSHGADLHVAAVRRDGLIDLAALEEHLGHVGEQTGIISVMLANNETGVIQPLEQIVELAARHGIAVHTDAVQSPGRMPLNFSALGVDALSLSGHKLGAPVGVGVLVASRDFTPTPHQHGGLQERGIRSGTVNAAGAAALAAALRVVSAEAESEHQRVSALRDRLQEGIRTAAPEAVIWGEESPRLPSHLLVSVPGTRSESVLFSLDMAGVAASAGSACQAGVVGASPVVLAMGGTEEEARSALRFTLGHTTTADDVDRALATLPDALSGARAALTF